MTRISFTIVVLALLLGSATFLLIAAPIPKAPKPSAETLLAVLGQSPVSPEVKAFVDQIGTLPKINYSYWIGKKQRTRITSFYLLWQEKGVEFFVLEDQIQAAFLYRQGADNYTQYPGQLPYGLSFDDDLATLAKKLGPLDSEPSVCDRPGPNGTTYDLIFADYKKGEVNVVLRRYPGKTEQIQHFGFHIKPKE
jgi:hypothetical protein